VTIFFIARLSVVRHLKTLVLHLGLILGSTYPPKSDQSHFHSRENIL